MLITPEYHAILRSVLDNHLKNPLKKSALDDLFEDVAEPYDLMDGVRVVPVHGPIGYRVSSLEASCGVCDIGTVGEWLDQAMSDTAVETVVMDFNTPGGETTFVQELAESIIDKCKKKNIVAYTDTMAASAGQWLAAATNEIYATKSAILGSIGCYCMMYDTSKMFENEGVKVEMFTSGDLKGIGANGVPLSDAQRAYLQEDVNKIGEKFRAFMKERMKGIPDDMMRGQGVSGEDMGKVGLITNVTSIQDIFND